MSSKEFTLERLQPLNEKLFTKIRNEHFKPSFDIPGLKYLRDKAGNERNLRELYRGRAPYELLQNADDAGATKVAFIVLRDGLGFLHDGNWFTVGNFISLADGWSDKDPKECIGHKGLGFRSVLDITPSPYLIKISNDEFLAIKFSWALNNGHIQEAFKTKPDLKNEYELWKEKGQSICPVMAIPGLAKKASLGLASQLFDRVRHGDLGTAYTTLFLFPSEDSAIEKKVLEDLDPMPLSIPRKGKEVLVSFMEKEGVRILPYLKSVKKMSVLENEVTICEVEVEGERTAQGVISIDIAIGSRNEKNSFFEFRKSLPIPDAVKKYPGTPKALKQISETEIVLSVRVKNDQPVSDRASRFHVYFPTEEVTGVGFSIHSDFFVKPDRTHLVPGNLFNDWLLNKIADIASGPFLSELLIRFRPSAVFTALAPTDQNGSSSPFLNHFQEHLKTRTDAFLPTRIGLRNRSEVVVPPRIDTGGFW